MDNSTLLNTTSTYAGCAINWETVYTAWFATGLVTSLASFVGNILLIVVVYRARTIRTSTDYFVVNMAASDIFLPFSFLVINIVIIRKDVSYLSQTTGTVLCKFLRFFTEVSYGVSMLSLTVIAVYRLYAVEFPMRARVQSRRTCIILLLLTWILPIVMSSPTLSFFSFNVEYQYCYMDLTGHQSRVWNIVYSSLFFFLALIVMLVLHPVIIVKLRRQKIPGIANFYQAVVKRRKQNLHLTTMFITITVAFVLCWGSYQVMNLVNSISNVTDWCTFDKVDNIVILFPVMFHAINPLIYFIFCSSYRQGIKHLLCCCYRFTHEQHAPADHQLQLGNIPQV